MTTVVDRLEAAERERSAVHGHMAYADVLATPCSEHGAAAGVPCHTAVSERGEFASMCGDRIRQAGYLNTVTISTPRPRRGRPAPSLRARARDLTHDTRER